MENYKILVVDDESRMRKLVKDFLVKSGYMVVEAENGEEAVDIFMSDKDIYVRTFSAREKHLIPVQETEESIAGGHGGGDEGIIYALYDYILDQYVGNSVPTITESLYNHMLVFAAEKSRKENKIVQLLDMEWGENDETKN